MLNIIMPLYKGKDTIRDAFNSLVAQTSNRFIVTVVQDADGEDYTEIREYYQKLLQIVWIELENNVGAGMARQVGIDNTKMCDYVAFLDADDMFMPRTAEVLYTYAKSKFADVVMGKIMVERKHQDSGILEGQRCHTWMHAKCYRLDYLRDNNIRFLPDIRFNEDVGFNLSAINSSKKVFYINEELYLWRDCNTSVTRDETSGFYIDGNRQFIYSFGMNLMRLIRSDLATKQILYSALVSLYREYELMVCKKRDLSQAQQLLRTILSEQVMQDILRDHKQVKDIAGSVQGAAATKTHYFFFKENFAQWVYNLVGLDIEENLCVTA